jgi:hypothetical protein
LTVTLAGLLAPPAPVQVIKYVVLMAMAAIVCVPVADFAPLQPPAAAQAVAFDELHVSVAALPAVTSSGLAESVMVGAGATLTVTLAGALVPPAPVQVMTYVTLAAKGPVAWVPLVDRAPFQLPEAVHAVAFIEVHVSVELDAPPTVVGEAASVTVAAGVDDELSPPPQDATSSVPKASHREYHLIIRSPGAQGPGNLAAQHYKDMTGRNCAARTRHKSAGTGAPLAV